MRGEKLETQCAVALQEPTKRTLAIRLMSEQDPSVDGGQKPTQRWREYVDSYVSRYPTEWQPGSADSLKERPGKMSSKVFLKRCVRNEARGTRH
jgi:hypothetical protein